MIDCRVLPTILMLIYCGPLTGAEAQSAAPLDIGSRMELFVNGWLIDSVDSVQPEMQNPWTRARNST